MANLSSVITQTVGSSSGGVNLITAPSSATIWTGSGLTMSTTTTTAELPLEGFVSTAAKFALTGSTTSSYVDFTVPDSLLSTKLEMKWFARDSGTIGTITLTLNSYSSAANRTSGTSATAITPQSSTLESATQSFQTTFDAHGTNQYYRLTLSFPAASSQWYSMAQFVVGPGTVVQGAAVSNPISFTASFNNVSMTQAHATYTRFGSWAYIEYDGTAASDATGIVAFDVGSIFTGATIDTSVWSGTSRQIAGHAWIGASTNNYTLAPTWSGSGNTIQFRTDAEAAGVGTTSPVPDGGFDSSDRLSFGIWVPISQWAGSGTVNLGAGAQVEYAYNSDVTSTASVTASGYAYGPSGVVFSSAWTGFGSDFVRRVQFQYPIQTDDVIVVEMSRPGFAANTWYPIDMVYPGITQGSNLYGCAIAAVSGSSTAVDVIFQRGGISPTNATFANNGTAWSALNPSFYWRVRKAKAGAPVGFGMANSSESGLVKPRKGQYSLTVTASFAGWSTTRAIGIYYQDQDGNHRLKFNIRGTKTSGATTGGTLTVSGVTFKNVSSWEQAGSGFTSGALPVGVYCGPNNSTIGVGHASATTDYYSVSGDVELESKPTWA